MLKYSNCPSIFNRLTSKMGKTRSNQVQRMAVSASSSTDSPDVQSARPSSRTSLRFMQESIQKIYPSHVSSSSQIQELQKALDDAKILNAKHQEQIETLTLERDAAESEIHINKRLSRSLEDDFCHSETSLEKTRALLQTALRQNEAQQMALGAQDKELEAKEKQIEMLQLESSNQNSQIELLQLEASNQTSEMISLTNEKMDLEDWISEIKACVKEVNKSYSNLENKVQTQNGIILQLKAENTRLEQRHESDVINLEMNKKALVRSNVELKRSCEDLQAKLQAEQEKSKATQPSIDWKAECLKIHKRKSIEIRNLKDQTERLQVENQEQYMELRTLRTAELEAVAKTELLNSVLSTTTPTAQDEPATPVTSNDTSGIVTLFDMPPDKVMNDSSAAVASLQPAKACKSRAFSDLAGVMVFMSCLLSALRVLSNC